MRRKAAAPTEVNFSLLQNPAAETLEKTSYHHVAHREDVKDEGILRQLCINFKRCWYELIKSCIAWLTEFFWSCRTTLFDTDLDTQCKEPPPRARVKSIDFHETEPNLLLASYHTGAIVLWDETSGMSRALQLTDESSLYKAVRSARFLHNRNDRFIAGGDDGKLYIVDTINLQVIMSFKAHDDFIRCISISGSKILSCSDDMSIKLWDADNFSTPPIVYREHIHYVMHVLFNHRSTNIFASASYDRTVRLWDTTMASTSNEGTEATSPLIPENSKTVNDKSIACLEGHVQCVNCIEFSGLSEELLISGADDGLRVWNWKTGECIFASNLFDEMVTSIFALKRSYSFVTASENGPFRFWKENKRTEWECEISIYIPTSKVSTLKSERSWVVTSAKDFVGDFKLTNFESCTLTLGTDIGVIQCDLNFDILRNDPRGNLVHQSVQVVQARILSNIHSFIGRNSLNPLKNNAPSQNMSKSNDSFEDKGENISLCAATLSSLAFTKMFIHIGNTGKRISLRQ